MFFTRYLHVSHMFPACFSHIAHMFLTCSFSQVSHMLLTVCMPFNHKPLYATDQRSFLEDPVVPLDLTEDTPRGLATARQLRPTRHLDKLSKLHLLVTLLVALLEPGGELTTDLRTLLLHGGDQSNKNRYVFK